MINTQNTADEHINTFDPGSSTKDQPPHATLKFWRVLTGLFWGYCETTSKSETKSFNGIL